MDSDEEYDRRRRRDKFRGERRDYTERGGRERDDRRRDDWQDRRGQMGTQMRNRNNRGGGGFRNDWNRREFQDYDRGGRQDRYSPPARRTDMSPPQKRQRRDWEGGYDGGHGNQGSHGYWGGGRGRQGQSHGSHDGESGGRSEGTTGTGQMLSFKQFLAKQEDSIDDQEAVKKYNEYKMEFHKAQLSEFFLAHKDEEWFRTKYYPDECDRQQMETEEAIDHRLRVFLEFLKKGDMEKVELQADKSESITRLLDSVVIRLEGGTDLDLTILDQPEMMQAYERPRTVSESQQRPSKSEDKPRDDKKEEGEESEEKEKDGEKKEGEGGEEGEKKENGEEKPGEEETPIPPPPTDDDGKVLPEPIPPPPAEDGDKKDEEEGEADKEPARKKKRGKKRKRPRDQEYSDSESDISSSSDSGSESEESEHEQGALEPEPAPPGLESGGDKGASESDNKLEEGEAKEEGEEEEEKEEGEKEEGEKEPDEPKPRALHKTYSIFIRNVSPIIKKEEIVALCKRYKGFLRVALAEPQPDRSYQRHGWVTFDRTVNIKEICWDLSSIRLRECELSPVVNRDLAHRIRAVSGIVAHKGIVKSDLKLAARLVQVMDQKHGLFTGESGWGAKKEKEREDKKKKEKEEKEKKKEEAAATAAAAAAEGEKEGEKKAEKAEEGSIEEKEEQPIPVEPKEPLPVRNPVLENITDYLVEELSAEEELLLGMRVDGLEEGQEMGEGDVTFDKDEHLCKVLDRLLLYLRIVHSLDYYNASKYQYNFEDEMPNRCGIMHCRGQNPPNRMTQKDVEAWKSNFESKVLPLINIKNNMTDEELVKLGKKDQELEVEKFVKANTKELAKDKWLCPLSGKKFKGPEFVRKHVFNKHGDKIDAVKKEVLFFNNFLQDSGKQKLMDTSKPKAAPAASNEREGAGDQGYNGQRGGNYNRGYQQQGSYEGQRERPQALYTQNRSYGQSGRGGYDQSYGNNYQEQQQQQRPFQRRSDPRSIIQYRDLDAPADSDFF